MHHIASEFALEKLLFFSSKNPILPTEFISSASESETSHHHADQRHHMTFLSHRRNRQKRKETTASQSCPLPNGTPSPPRSYLLKTQPAFETIHPRRKHQLCVSVSLCPRLSPNNNLFSSIPACRKNPQLPLAAVSLTPVGRSVPPFERPYRRRRQISCAFGYCCLILTYRRPYDEVMLISAFPSPKYTPHRGGAQEAWSTGVPRLPIMFHHS